MITDNQNKITYPRATEIALSELERFQTTYPVSERDELLIKLCAISIFRHKELIDGIYSKGKLLGIGIGHRFLIEALIFQSSFIGWPAVLDSISLLIKQKINDDLFGVLSFDDEDAVRERGYVNFQNIHGENSKTVQAMLNNYSPKLFSDILLHVYGRYYDLKGITPEEKEIIAVTSLAILDRGLQLKSHIISTLNMGLPHSYINVTLQ
ncbi:MAG: hypothetical protein AB1480_08875 [Nitrospirota bacterium]